MGTIGSANRVMDTKYICCVIFSMEDNDHIQVHLNSDEAQLISTSQESISCYVSIVLKIIILGEQLGNNSSALTTNIHFTLIASQ